MLAAVPLGRQSAEGRPRPRALAATLAVLVACYPTRGLDFAATRRCERLLVAAREHGAAVLFVSVDLDELLALARPDRRHAGRRITGELTVRGRATPEQLGLLMGGAAA